MNNLIDKASNTSLLLRRHSAAVAHAHVRAHTAGFQPALTELSLITPPVITACLGFQGENDCYFRLLTALFTSRENKRSPYSTRFLCLFVISKTTMLNSSQ